MRRSPPDQRMAAPAQVLNRQFVRWPVGLSGWCRASKLLVPAFGLLPLAAAWAQADTAARTVAIQPSASVTQTFSDNIHLDSVNPASGSITQISAGVGLRARTGMVRGFLDYSLSRYLYSGGNQNTLQNALNASLDTDLVDGRAKLAATANIAQSAVSAFGAQPGGAGGSQTNATEVRNLRVAPSFRGPVGAALRYTAELSYALTDARDSAVGDGSTLTAALHLEPTTTGRLGWSVDASHLRSTYKLGRTTTNDRLFGGAAYRVDDLDLLLQATGGLEASDISSVNRTNTGTWGFGAAWVPSPRTRVAAQYDHRFFGASHSLTVEHRTALTAWRLTDSRSLSTAGNQAGFGGLGTANDLANLLFAGEPDLGKRQELASKLLDALQIDAGKALGFLRSSATLQDAQEASVAWRDVRSAAVLSFTRTTTRRLDTIAGLVGDLASSSIVRQRGLTLNLSHRLTPLSTVSLLLGEQRGAGVLASQGSKQRLASLQYTNRPTEYSALSVGLRRAQYNTGAVSYGENALFASYGIRF